ncbi:hypothetical protein [Sorangium sp. So ce1078]|uniref:hypothetical protein n=1 Tax=Sorangium sp. So ce1078 TaxID=3133329 RepID=UPI003F63C58E
MSRSTERTPRGRVTAAFQKLVATVTALSILAPSRGWAGTPYSLSWSRFQSSLSCEGAFLVESGDAFFSVNDTPLPTYEVPGALVIQGDGSQSNKAEAGFDSVLFRMGANELRFHVRNSSGDDSCTHSQRW